MWKNEWLLGGVAVLAVLGAWAGFALTADLERPLDAEKIGSASGAKATTMSALGTKW